jgi:ATP-dependent protease ClpP protease subunit
MSKILQLIRDNAAHDKRPLNVARNAAEASLYIYDVIDSYWGVSAAGVINALEAAGDAEVLHVYINSPGGDVFEGRAIMAALARFKGKKIAHIDSLCASAATSIALACNEVEMTDGAFFMIHNASGMAWGDKNAMRETADLLEQVEGSIVNDYTTKTGQSTEQVVQWMNDETWFTAAQALEHGFIDRVADSPAKAALNNAATWNLAAYAKAPANLITPPPADPAPAAIAEPAPVAAPAIENVASADEPAAQVEPAGPCLTQSNRNRLTLILAL